MIEIILIIILLLLSAFFSSSETALTSLNKAKIRRIEDKKLRELLEWMENNKNYVLTGILIGNNLVNIAISSITTVLIDGILQTLHWDQGLSIVLTLVIVTPLILIFGEIIPKNIAAVKPLETMRLLARPLYYSLKILTIFIILFDLIVKIVVKIFNLEKTKVDKEDIKNTIEIGSEEGAISEEEVSIIKNALEMSDRKIKDILTPINKVIGVWEDDKVKDVLEIAKKYKYSRYPVFDVEKTKIIGFIHIKDIFNANPEDSVKKYIRKIINIDEDLNIKTSFEVMRKNNTHIACVLNRYGVPVGIVTLEDILEELVGEIYDEVESNDNKGNI